MVLWFLIVSDCCLLFCVAFSVCRLLVLFGLLFCLLLVFDVIKVVNSLWFCVCFCDWCFLFCLNCVYSDCFGVCFMCFVLFCFGLLCVLLITLICVDCDVACNFVA